MLRCLISDCITIASKGVHFNKPQGRGPLANEAMRCQRHAIQSDQLNIYVSASTLYITFAGLVTLEQRKPVDADTRKQNEPHSMEDVHISEHRGEISSSERRLSTVKKSLTAIPIGKVFSSAMPSWSVNSVLRHGSIQVSLDSEDRLVKRGLTTEWTAHYVRLFEKVRQDVFTAQADQLRTHFNTIQNSEDKLLIARTIFTKEFLASQQKALAERIEKAMVVGHFEMPNGHEKWYHIAWHDRRTPGEDATAYHAELYIQMMLDGSIPGRLYAPAICIKRWADLTTTKSSPSLPTLMNKQTLGALCLIGPIAPPL
jgi:hypothetical protein